MNQADTTKTMPFFIGVHRRSSAANPLSQVFDYGNGIVSQKPI
jgi:hypothetical protein